MRTLGTNLSGINNVSPRIGTWRAATRTSRTLSKRTNGMQVQQTESQTIPRWKPYFPGNKSTDNPPHVTSLRVILLLLKLQLRLYCDCNCPVRLLPRTFACLLRRLPVRSMVKTNDQSAFTKPWPSIQTPGIFLRSKITLRASPDRRKGKHWQRECRHPPWSERIPLESCWPMAAIDSKRSRVLQRDL